MVDDIDFKQAMQDVRPLRKDENAQTLARRKPDRALGAQIQNRARQSARLEKEINTTRKAPSREGVSNHIEDEELFYLSHGMQKKVLRELKKGSRYTVEQVLDLHGLIQLQAHSEIDLALQDIDSAQPTCLLIIHGKGLHSPDGATLKEFTAAYLKTLPAVKAYCSAQQRDGGTGALYVLVKG